MSICPSCPDPRSPTSGTRKRRVSKERKQETDASATPTFSSSSSSLAVFLLPAFFFSAAGAISSSPLSSFLALAFAVAAFLAGVDLAEDEVALRFEAMGFSSSSEKSDASASSEEASDLGVGSESERRKVGQSSVFVSVLKCATRLSQRVIMSSTRFTHSSFWTAAFFLLF